MAEIRFTHSIFRLFWRTGLPRAISCFVCGDITARVTNTRIRLKARPSMTFISIRQLNAIRTQGYVRTGLLNPLAGMQILMAQ